MPQGRSRIRHKKGKRKIYPKDHAKVTILYASLEMKRSIQTQVVTPIVTTGQHRLLNGLTQGDLLNQRNGRSILGRYLDFSLWLKNGHVDAQSFRALIVQYKQPSATNLVIANVFQDSTSGTTMSYSLPNLIWVGSKRPFKILKDIKMFPAGINDKAGVMKKFRINLRNMKTRFNNNNNGDFTDIVTNAIYLVILGTQAAGNWAYMSDFQFTDS